MDAQESMGEHAALKIGAHLPLDETGDWSARRPGAFEEGLEVFTHDAVEERLLGLVAFVANGSDFAGTGIETHRVRNRRADGRLQAVRYETATRALIESVAGRMRTTRLGSSVNLRLSGRRTISAVAAGSRDCANAGRRCLADTRPSRTLG